MTNWTKKRIDAEFAVCKASSAPRRSPFRERMLTDEEYRLLASAHTGYPSALRALAAAQEENARLRAAVEAYAEWTRKRCSLRPCGLARLTCRECPVYMYPLDPATTAKEPK